MSWYSPSVALASAIVLTAVLAPSQCLAGENYACVIDRIVLAEGDNGKVFEQAKRDYIGQRFSVNRTSGVMEGALKNSYVTSPQVIDRGSNQNSFKVVTTMRIDQGAGYGSNIYALTIAEYKSGPKKPFIFLDNASAYLGKCVHV